MKINYMTPTIPTVDPGSDTVTAWCRPWPAASLRLRPRTLRRDDPGDTARRAGERRLRDPDDLADEDLAVGHGGRTCRIGDRYQQPITSTIKITAHDTAPVDLDPLATYTPVTLPGEIPVDAATEPNLAGTAATALDDTLRMLQWMHRRRLEDDQQRIRHSRGLGTDRDPVLNGIMRMLEQKRHRRLEDEQWPIRREISLPDDWDGV
jgi:hypothetical protein